MPKVSLPVLETENNFVRPVVLEVARQFMAITGIPDSTIIYYPGDLERAAQPGTNMTERVQPNVTPSMQKLSIEVTEEYHEDHYGEVTAAYANEPLFFADNKLGVQIKPIYIGTEYTLAFKYRAKDVTTAKRWRDDMKTKMGLMREQNVHHASYSYGIPLPFIVVLHEVHRLRENVEGYGDTFEEYFNAHASKCVTKLTTQIGTGETLAVAETAREILGWYEFTGAPEKEEREGEGPTWTVSFEYKFRIHKPVECEIFYPPVVHQQPIKYIPQPLDVPERHIAKVSLAMYGQKSFEAQHEGKGLDRKTMGYSIPRNDEFIPNMTLPNTMRIIEVLAGLDAADPQFLFNLNELGDVEFTPAIKRFLVTEAPFMTKMFRSLFCLSLYRNNDLVESGSLVVDADLNVRLKNPQSLRDVYRVRLDLFIDWSVIDPVAIVRGRHDGEALVEIIKTIDPSLPIPDFLGDNYIPKKPIQDIIDQIVKQERGGSDSIYQFNTVGTFLIVAHRGAYNANS